MYYDISIMDDAKTQQVIIKKSGNTGYAFFVMILLSEFNTDVMQRAKNIALQEIQKNMISSPQTHKKIIYL